MVLFTLFASVWPLLVSHLTSRSPGSPLSLHIVPHMALLSLAVLTLDSPDVSVPASGCLLNKPYHLNKPSSPPRT